MKSSVEVTILMSAYNAEAYIDQAIQSILDQDFTNWELLISDDCSVDKTCNKAMKFSQRDPRIKVFRHTENKGYLLNTNSIWEKATGTYITFQDADDWSPYNRLSEQLELLKKGYDICTSNFFRVAPNGDLIQKSNLNATVNQEDFKDFIEGNTELPVFAGSMIFHRSVSDELGFYDPFFSRKCGEDTFWILKASKDFKFVNCLDALYFYRENPTSVTQTLTVDKLINEQLIKNIYLNFHQKKVIDKKDRETENYLKIEQQLRQPYLDDTSKLHYTKSLNSIYHKNYREAFNNVCHAIFRKPFKLQYYKTAFFILKNINER